jgi:transposase
MKRIQSTTKKRSTKPRKTARRRSSKPIIAGGIDTGKDWLDAAIYGAACKPLRRPNTPQGRTEIIQFFEEYGVTRAGIEASGSYEFEMVDAMRDAGLEVAVLQPGQVRAYAKFLNLRAKTDPIDAWLIARCAAAQAEVRAKPDPRLAAFAEHLTFIDQIEEDIARLRTRRDRYRDDRLIAELKQEIARQSKRKREELVRLRKAVRAHADLARKLDLLVSIEGLGARTALTLVVRMPELGTLTREQISSLGGMAPFTQKSGRWEGEAHVAGGRARVGKALYAAAQAASQRWNKALVDLYNRLIAKGKHHCVAVVACARKLVIYANTILARGTPWEAAKR